jgi:hypothetical protein
VAADAGRSPQPPFSVAFGPARLHFALGLMNVPLLFRGFGVLFAIWFFLSASTSWHEPWPKEALGYVLPALLLVLCTVICIPFSRLRNARAFGILVSAYAVAFLGFVGIHAWSGFHQMGTPGFFFHIILVAPVALLLFVQLSCILYSWSRRKHEP